MRFSTLLLLTLTSITVSSPTNADPNLNLSLDALLSPNCGYPNGNCYDNDCHGERSSNRITCTSGQYNGCECGYGCGRNVGPCYENGCDGRNGRCTNNYLGCNCRG